MKCYIIDPFSSESYILSYKQKNLVIQWMYLPKKWISWKLKNVELSIDELKNATNIFSNIALKKLFNMFLNLLFFTTLRAASLLAVVISFNTILFDVLLFRNNDWCWRGRGGVGWFSVFSSLMFFYGSLKWLWDLDFQI